MMEHIIIPYVQKQRNTLKLDAEYPAMLLMDVFNGQITDPVKEILKRNNIILQKVPANLTYLFQPLDVQVGPNGYAKRFMKKKFIGMLTKFNAQWIKIDPNQWKRY